MKDLKTGKGEQTERERGKGCGAGRGCQQTIRAKRAEGFPVPLTACLSPWDGERLIYFWGVLARPGVGWDKCDKWDE